MPIFNTAALPVTAAEAATPLPVIDSPPPELRFEDLPRGPAGELIRYGWRIIDNTPAALGTTDVDNRLSCRNCHLDHGTRRGAFPWLETAARPPRYAEREGRLATLADRVNFCLMRNLNRPPLPENSLELQGVLAYVRYLANLSQENASEPVTFVAPARAANPIRGEAVYRQHCLGCHGDDIEKPAARDIPPLWGAQSYTEGAEMHRLQTAAGFIQANMPSAMALSAEEALDVAAFINFFTRPATGDLSRDYPALSDKPADCPYPPYPDNFSASQHKYGPFAPIKKVHQEQKESDFRLYLEDRQRSAAR